MNITLNAQSLEKELESARAAVAASGLPAALTAVDAGAFGTTALNLQALECVAGALACARAAAAAGGVPPVYAAYIFAQEAAERLASASGPSALPETAMLPGQHYKAWAALSLDALAGEILADCTSFLKFYSGHSDSARRPARDSEAARCLASYFTLLARALKTVEKEPADLLVSGGKLSFAGWKISRAGADEPGQLLPVTFDDLVGNTEFVTAGKRLARDIAGFDLKANKNPKKVRNQILFVLGKPGCGKTVTSHAIGRYFLDICEKSGLPAKMRVIRRTDWASSYQNQSAKGLLDIFKTEVFDYEGVCGVYWPDIDTAFSARSDGDIRQEEKNILGTVFGILDGTIGPKNGKWFLICDANTVHMDEATLSRISQNPINAAGPETPADFVRLLRDVKLKGKEAWLPISQEQWDKLGARCVAEGLAGRAVEHLAGRVITSIEDFEEPESYFSLSFEGKQKMIAELSRPVTFEKLMEMLESYCRFEKEAQRRSEEEKFLDRVKEIRFNLSAQQAALGVFDGNRENGK
ncbi:MAG TPA: AAA family ATPase [Elusimicrobiales bacterium]|nr:AAA family ATPase [Elusimicrobiales bacterium]